MRAAVYRGVDDMRVERVPIPEIGPGEALVKIDCCGVCGTDIKKVHYGLVAPPRIFGHEMAGKIAALGAGVQGWRVGDRVAVMHHVPCLECYYCKQRDYAQCATYLRTGTTSGFEPAGGGFAEYIRVMDWIVQRGMVRLPDDVSYEEATFIEPVNTCLKAVLKANVTPGQTVFIVGQGQIGLLFTQLAKWRDATVFASDRMDYRLETSLAMGATAVFRAGEADIPSEICARTDGRGADLAIVAVADNAVVAEAFQSVRAGGKVMLFAATRLGDPLQVDAGAVCMLEKDLIGSYSADVTIQDETANLIFNRVVNVRDLVTHRFPLEEIGAAIHMAVNPQQGSLKVMVKL